MAYIPHTEEDIQKMLDTIGVSGIETLFEEIPAEIRADGIPDMPQGQHEMAVLRHFRRRAREEDCLQLNFVGAGAYQHYIPAAVWELANRGEFSTAYTPYQPEASQGGLEIIYDYQTMMASLTGLEVSNASMYEGASALAEAVLMAVRANRKARSKQILIGGRLPPNYRRVIETLTCHQGIVLHSLDFDCDRDIALQLDELANEQYAAVIIPQPDFLGQLQQVDTLTDWGHQNGALIIGVVNPMALALVAPPGQWGQKGADIACGEGQPLGIPLSGGGPYYGFMTCTKALLRQLPGRIVGRTVDRNGTPCYCLTAQAREQHIRRSKATSNICTNQGLMVTASTIYLSLMGSEGLYAVALRAHQNTAALVSRLQQVRNVSVLYAHNFFHEIVVRLPVEAAVVTRMLARDNIQAGLDLSILGEQWRNCLLVCSTEVHTEHDHQCFVERLEAVVREVS